MRDSSMMTAVLISLVEISWMLMPPTLGFEKFRGHAAVGAHADADDA